VDEMKRLFKSSSDIKLSRYSLDMAAAIFNIIRGCESWRIYGDWLQQAKPQLSEMVQARLSDGSHISPGEEAVAREAHHQLSDFIEELVAHAGVLCLPTTWTLPPEQSATPQALAENRMRNVLLTSLATIAGLPQVSLPVEIKPSVKMGLSLIGSRGTDLQLLDLAVMLEREHVSLGHMAPY